MSANVGSVATLVGNPQNMIIGHLSHIPFLRFSFSLLPVEMAGLAIQYAVLSFGFRKVLRAAAIYRPAVEPRKLDRRLLIMTLVVLGLVFLGFMAGLNLPWTALAGGALSWCWRDVTRTRCSSWWIGICWFSSRRCSSSLRV